ncbi:MAG: universal stress protein [Flavobacteriales bacterium]|nr:universal stress protein [Flavobacteriales bacterium]MCB9192200.1 universal stress protein [Flavobacteriales bacterium]MCB9205645.1 universal stress protein [Flavobacteriales bacterium]
MKNILVPFDFSHHSRNALEYAAQLAAKSGAKLCVFHTYDRSEVLEGVKVATTVSAMEDTKAKLAKQFGLEAKKITGKVVQGEFIEEVLEFIEGKNFDMIVVGTRGASGLRELLVGSYTVNLMQEIKGIPMLVVPEKADFISLRNILLCSDLHEIADDDALDLVKELAILFNADVRLAHVEKGKGSLPTYENVLEQRREIHLFEPEVDCTYKRIVASDFLTGIKFYMDKKGDNDMVAMVYREHSFIETIFGLNHTHEMAYHTTVPLLVLPESNQSIG